MDIGLLSKILARADRTMTRSWLIISLRWKAALAVAFNNFWGSAISRMLTRLRIFSTVLPKKRVGKQFVHFAFKVA